MVDTLALGASGRKAVEVRVLFPAPPTASGSDKTYRIGRKAITGTSYLYLKLP